MLIIYNIHYPILVCERYLKARRLECNHKLIESAIYHAFGKAHYLDLDLPALPELGLVLSDKIRLYFNDGYWRPCNVLYDWVSYYHNPTVDNLKIIAHTLQLEWSPHQ